MKYVISDIHGNYELFVKLLKKIHFSKKDTIFIVGDIIDKGKDVENLLNLIFNVLKDNAVVLLGNHEYSFNSFAKSLIKSNVGDETIINECKNYLNVKNLSFDDIENLMCLQAYYEEDDFILAHAGVPINDNGELIPLSKASVEELVFDRRFKEKNFIPQNSKCVIFGHTPTYFISEQKGKILKYKRANTLGTSPKDYFKIHIDTGNYVTGILGCLRLDDMQEFYVNEFEK